jgi:hypothetical protein
MHPTQLDRRAHGIQGGAGEESGTGGTLGAQDRALIRPGRNQTVAAGIRG